MMRVGPTRDGDLLGAMCGTSSGYCSVMRYSCAVPRALAITLAATVALLSCMALIPVQASALGTPSDAAATRKFLEAVDAWLQSRVANAPASAASMQAFVQKVGAECPDVFRASQPRNR